MIKLNFTEKELETLNEYFQTELYKAEQKIDSIRGILGKIGKKSGKFYKSEIKENKRGRKPNLSSSVNVKIKKRPGPKPKAIKEDEITAVAKVLKKRGRPPKKEVAAPKISALAEKKKRSPKSTSVPGNKIQQSILSSEPIKRKPGRPRLNAEKVVAEKKNKAGRPTIKKITKGNIRKEPPKPLNKTLKKGDIKSRRTPWGDWILTVLRDSDVNLTQNQIINHVANRLQIAENDIAPAETKLQGQIMKLIQSKKIVMTTEGENNVYSLNIKEKDSK
jgi:hypothetical protein